MLDYLKEYTRWKEREDLDSDVREALLKMEDNDDEKKMWFSSDISFGTAGLRGIMTAGTNAMNVYTVGRATQGIANLINSIGKADRGVAIAYDCRNNAERFAKVSAEVLAANGVKAYIFESLRPTPVLSFALRELNCIAGINITASHNPSKYNGYKAYWEDGAQLASEEAKTVAEYMSKTDIFDDVKRVDFDSAVKDGKIVIIGREIDEKYLKNVKEQAIYPELFEKVADTLKIVYTPLHGTGRVLVPEILKQCGLKYLYTVDSQMAPNGNFPGTPNPNPEFPEVFEEGIKLAESVKSDLIIATDPDADRVGIMARKKDGEFTTLTGNQVGSLLLDYVITAYKEKGIKLENPYAVKTIVSTELATKICKDNEVVIHNVLTGFKFIGEVIKNYEAKGYGDFMLGFEESYGYLKGTYARDKDAVVATMLICEMAAYYMQKNMTLYDALLALYEKYGYYFEGVQNIYMEGLDGKEKMDAFMENLRNDPPKTMGGIKVTSVRDYKTGIITDVETGNTEPTGLPSSNVLYYVNANGDVVVVRPSGTEPKLKLYFLVNGETPEKANMALAACKETMQSYL
ncbi:MAG: phospho-sugar mutase [Ruminococcaceae bacterium]|nr:phospho-sugar mutase [Oscillospiraceae bacterium]